MEFLRSGGILSSRRSIAKPMVGVVIESTQCYKLHDHMESINANSDMAFTAAKCSLYLLIVSFSLSGIQSQSGSGQNNSKLCTKKLSPTNDHDYHDLRQYN